MTDARPSLIGLELDESVADIREVIARARAAGGIDRAAAHHGDGSTAQDVYWGGRMQRAIVRTADDAGAPLLLSEVTIAADGIVEGLSRQATLLLALASVLPDRIRGVRDLSARVARDTPWLARVATGVVATEDAVVTVVGAAPTTSKTTLPADRNTVGWVLTHGAARLGIPDLELYGVPPGALDAARAVLTRVAAQLATGGLGAALSLKDGTRLRLVPVLEVWSALPAAWPGSGRAGVDRGPGLDGPRATLSIMHRPRLGRHRLDLDGVRERLRAQD
jgi:hypothetical protein